MIWGDISGFRHAAFAQARLERILDSWEGTAYVPGQQMKGAGVDCVRFVCAVLDELYGFKRVPLPELPADLALHQRNTAIAAMRYIIGLYEPNVSVEDGRLEPGDILVVAQKGGGPGHAMIVGARKNELWHSNSRRVQMTGIGFLGEEGHGYKLYGVYRLLDRERWAA